MVTVESDPPVPMVKLTEFACMVCQASFCLTDALVKCYRLISIPQRDKLKPHPQYFVSVILFGKRVFANIIKLS